MKLLLVLLALLVLTSCNDEVITRLITKEVPTIQNFEGVYYFPNGGRIELLAGENGDISIIKSGQELITVNPKDDTLAYHKPVEAFGLTPQGNTLTFTRNVSYTLSNGVETDTSKTFITGTKKTQYTFEYLGVNNLRVTIDIYDGKINEAPKELLVSRVLESI